VVPFAGGYSTTSIIDRIEDLQGISASAIELPAPQRQPAVFVDRDGTLNEHVEYLHQPEKFKLIPGALEALKLLKDAGFRIVVITNQPGIGMGYFTREEFFKINRLFLNAAHKLGLMIDKVYFCPHSVAENCPCRKPKTALIDRAVKELNIDLSQSYMVGDTTLDLMLGQNAGCRTILVQSGIAGKDKTFEVEPDNRVENLGAAVDHILRK